VIALSLYMRVSCREALKIYPSEKDRRNDRNAVSVRLIEYRLAGAPNAEPMYRLLTTVLDH